MAYEDLVSEEASEMLDVGAVDRSVLGRVKGPALRDTHSEPELAPRCRDNAGVVSAVHNDTPKAEQPASSSKPLVPCFIDEYEQIIVVSAQYQFFLSSVGVVGDSFRSSPSVVLLARASALAQWRRVGIANEGILARGARASTEARC